MKEQIRQFLIKNADKAKAEFDSKIVRTKLQVLGIKMAVLDSFARTLARENVGLEDFDFIYHEEVILFGMMIGYKECSAQEKIEFLERLFPHFDNWAVVDSVIPRLRSLKNERVYFENLLNSNDEFVCRSGIVFLMKFVLPCDLKAVVNLLKANIKEPYYIKMAISWCYAEAFIKDSDYMKSFIKQIDDKFVRNKSIQKACESFRLTKEQKEEIRALKI